MRLPALILAIATLSGMAISAKAQTVELVTNGGFDTGDFTGWDASPGGGTVPGTFDGSYVASGGHMADGCVNIYGDTASTITQTLNTTVGISYTVSLWATGGDGGGGSNYGSGANGEIFVDWNGSRIIDQSNVQIDDTFTTWNHFSTSIIASSATTTFVVGARNSYWNFLIDDISVTSVPEPAGYGLIAGVSALGFVVWRRVGQRA